MAVTGVARANPATDDDAYRLPLVGPYAIYRPMASLTPRAETRPSELIQSSAPDGPNGWSSTKLLGDVKQVAVERNIVFGKAKDGYFVLDGNAADAKPATYESPEAWQAALDAAGVSNAASSLKTPDALAVGLPLQSLRPWNYRVMRNRLGFSDDEWSAVLQALGALLAFLIGLAWTGRRRPIPEAVGLGVVVNVVAQIVIAGGGPGAFVGLVVLPLIYIIAAAIGMGVRGLVRMMFS
jgi:hypothetical protein